MMNTSYFINSEPGQADNMIYPSKRPRMTHFGMDVVQARSRAIQRNEVELPALVSQTLTCLFMPTTCVRAAVAAAVVAAGAQSGAFVEQP